MRSRMHLLAVASVFLAAFIGGAADAFAAPVEGSAEVAEAATEEHHETGPPLNFKADLALWSLVTFVFFVLVLRWLAWKPLIAGLQKRESDIRKDIDDARQERELAAKMRSDYEGMLEAAEDKVRAIYSEAHAKAEEIRAQKLAEANREAEERKERAITEIERAKDQALHELFDAMASRVADATEHVLGRSLNDEDQSRLIDQALAEFASRPQQA